MKALLLLPLLMHIHNGFSIPIPGKECLRSSVEQVAPVFAGLGAGAGTTWSTAQWMRGDGGGPNQMVTVFGRIVLGGVGGYLVGLPLGMARGAYQKGSVQPLPTSLPLSLSLYTYPVTAFQCRPAPPAR